MKKPVLLVMAAGMGSRYGGLKQMEPITDQGEIIIDFSLYDAMMAGFEKAVFVIREELEEDFKELLLPRAGKYMDIEFVYQELEDLPGGCALPEGRTKPWGTGHAIMSGRHAIDGPFAVINADDYYGSTAFAVIYDYLLESQKEEKDAYDFTMVAYQLKNTLTENGTVARGVCEVDDKGNLSDIVERLQIKQDGDTAAYLGDDKKTWVSIDNNTPVSMNLWGYTADMMKELENRFKEFYDTNVADNPLKAEYMIPVVTDQLIKEGKATVHVLNSADQWYGITYKEDRESVVNAIQSMKDKGLYPDKLWK